MKITLSKDFTGPHNGEYRLPDVEGVDFESAIRSLSQFMDFYSTAPATIFELDTNLFTEKQKKVLVPIFKKKNLKIT